jgi:hypothetical protein
MKCIKDKRKIEHYNKEETSRRLSKARTFYENQKTVIEWFTGKEPRNSSMEQYWGQKLSQIKMGKSTQLSPRKIKRKGLDNK